MVGKYPKYVYKSHKRIVYRPYIKKADRGVLSVDRGGFLSPPICLGSIHDSYDDIIKTYQRVSQDIEKQQHYKKGTLGNIAQNYFKSDEFSNLAKSSQRKNKTLIQILDHQIKINRKACVLGDLRVAHVTKPFIRQMMAARLEEHKERGNAGYSQVNREISLLTTIIGWALNYVDGLGIIHNPLLGIYKYKENVKDRYVTDDDFNQQKAIAENIADYLPIVFDIAYLCACRSSEVLSIKLSDLTEQGIVIHRKKGSNDNIILWSPALEKTINSALELRKRCLTSDSDHEYLITNTKGLPLLRSGLDSAMQRLRREMKRQGKSGVFWVLHDLKRKGISDAENGRIGGHKSPQMIERYTTKLKHYSPPR